MNYLRFLEDGLLLDGKTRRKDSVCASSAPVAELTAAQQTKKWGFPYFEHLTKDEYERALSGRPAAVEEAPAPAKSRAGRAAKPKAPTKNTKAAVRAAAKAAVVAPKVGLEKSTTVAPSEAYVPPSEDEVLATAEPIKGYSEMSLDQVVKLVAAMGDGGAETFLAYEASTLNRPEFIAAFTTGEV